MRKSPAVRHAVRHWAEASVDQQDAIMPIEPDMVDEVFKLDGP